MNSGNFFAELKRRNVYKVAVAYAIVAWLLIQVATQVFPFFEIPNWAVRLVVLLVILGFPIALFLAWAFEITPEGIKRAEDVDLNQSITKHTGRKLIWTTVVLGFVAAGLLGFQLLRPKSAVEGTMPWPKCRNQRWFIATRAVSGFFSLASHCANARRRPVLVAGYSSVGRGL